jgi:hypothetical protein
VSARRSGCEKRRRRLLGRFAFGWSRSGSFSAAGRDAGQVDLGFLGPLPFRSERPALVGWILLDFLGFSRPNRDFSMGYADFSRKNISRAFSVAIAAPEREPAVEAMRKRRIIHGASLTWFLIICNRLSSAPFPFAPPRSLSSGGPRSTALLSLTPWRLASGRASSSPRSGFQRHGVSQPEASPCQRKLGRRKARQ